MTGILVIHHDEGLPLNPGRVRKHPTDWGVLFLLLTTHVVFFVWLSVAQCCHPQVSFRHCNNTHEHGSTESLLLANDASLHAVI